MAETMLYRNPSPTIAGLTVSYVVWSANLFIFPMFSSVMEREWRDFARETTVS